MGVARECGRPVRRQSFEVEVVFFDDGRGDDWGAVIADALGAGDQVVTFALDRTGDVVLVPERLTTSRETT